MTTDCISIPPMWDTFLLHFQYFYFALLSHFLGSPKMVLSLTPRPCQNMETQRGCVSYLISPHVPEGVSGKSPRPKAPEPPHPPAVSFHPHRPSTMGRLASAPHPRPSKSSLTRVQPTSGCPPPSAALSTRPVVSPPPYPCPSLQDLRFLSQAPTTPGQSYLTPSATIRSISSLSLLSPPLRGEMKMPPIFPIGPPR